MVSYLNNVEAYLGTAPVLCYISPPAGGGGHPGKFSVVLNGGVTVLVKPSDTMSNADPMQSGLRAVKNEVAGWEAAKLLECSQFVGATVLRSLTSSTGTGGVISSAQVIWPAVLPHPSLNSFSDGDIWRAAIFDFVTGCTDRGGDNWGGIQTMSPTGTAMHLVLFDNAFSWDWPGRGLQSTFVTAKSGQRVPDPLLATVDTLQAEAPSSPLAALLEATQIDALLVRCQWVLDHGILPN